MLSHSWVIGDREASAACRGDAVYILQSWLCSFRSLLVGCLVFMYTILNSRFSTQRTGEPTHCFVLLR